MKPRIRMFRSDGEIWWCCEGKKNRPYKTAAIGKCPLEAYFRWEFSQSVQAGE